MGGGLTTAQLTKDDYICIAREKLSTNDNLTEIVELKKNLLQKQNSHPDLITTKTVFTPYIDVRVKSKDVGAQHLQRATGQNKASAFIGNGEMPVNLKKCEYFEVSKKTPWLIKNAHFIRPSVKDFDFERAIGAGRTATVVLAKTRNNKFCVLKCIKKDYIFKNHEMKHILNERDALYQLNSSFIMKLLAEVEDTNMAYFVLEYAPGGELKSLLREWGMFGAERTKFYMAEVLTAIEHMHKHGIVYRNLCPENIAIDEEGHIKIIDFGSAIRENYNLNGKMYTICCSVGYLSPEQLNGKFEGGYGREVDLWQFGIVLYELMAGNTPFISNKNDSKYEILMRILRHKLKFHKHFDPVAKDLVNKILNPEIEQRLIVPKDIRNHEFFLTIKDWKDVGARRLIPPYVPRVRSEGDSSNFKITEGSAKHWKLGALENKVHLY